MAMHHLNAKSQEIYRQIGLAQVISAVGATNNIMVLPPFIAESYP